MAENKGEHRLKKDKDTNTKKDKNTQRRKQFWTVDYNRK